MTSEKTDISRIIEMDSGIDAECQHKSKQVLPLNPLVLFNAVLKWYEIYPEHRPAPDDVTQMARKYLMKTFLDAREPGFVFLHRRGADFYFLIICTWRNWNELWERFSIKIARQ